MSGFSVYPNQIDTSTQLPIATDSVTEVKAEVVNRLRDAILAVENELGINPSGTFSTVKDRLNNLETIVSNINLISVTCDSSVSIGQVVYFTGETAFLANAGGINTYPATAFVVSKTDATTAVIQISGLVTTNSLISGQEYFLSTTSGEIISTPPSSSGQIIQTLGIALTSNILNFQPNMDYLIL